MFSRRFIRGFVRRFWTLVFTLIIATAVLVQLGRQAFPLLDDYKFEIAGYIGKKLGLTMEVARIEADWSSLRPKLSLHDVTFSAPGDERVFTFDHASVELGILASIANRRFSWRYLVFEGFDTTLHQDAEGRWSIPGLPPFKANEDGNRFRFDDPYDLFLLGRRIEISRAAFSLRYHSGETASIFIPEIAIDNDQEFHRIRARADVGGDLDALNIVIEATGNARQEGVDVAPMVVRGFAELKALPSQDVLEALAVPQSTVDASEHTTDFRLWFSSDSRGDLEFRGDLVTGGKLLLEEASRTLEQRLATRFVGSLAVESGWRLALADTELIVGERGARPPTLQLHGNWRGAEGLSLDHVQVEDWAQLALDSGLLGPMATKYLSGINPRGQLHDLRVSLVSPERGYFSLQAQVVEGRCDAFMGAPALDNLKGAVSATALSGMFRFAMDDGLTVDLPKVYDRPLNFDAASGSLRWQIDLEKRFTYLDSGPLWVRNAEEEARGYLALSLPFSKERGEQEMTLVIGSDRMPALSHKRYVPRTAPKPLRDWLDRAVLGGEVHDARFVYSGSIEKGPDRQPSLQLYGELRKGRVAFDPGWPALRQVSGRLRVDDQELDVRIDHAAMMDTKVRDLAVGFVADTSTGGRALSITGTAAGDAAQAMKILANSPLRDQIGEAPQSWNYEGPVEAAIDLTIPLRSGSRAQSTAVRLDFRGVDVAMPELRLAFDDVKGILRYRDGRGFFGQGLGARFWDQDFVVDVESPKVDNGERETRIHFDGVTEMARLRNWLDRPELLFIDGESRVSGMFRLPAPDSRDVRQLVVASDLVGTSFALPAPYDKPSEAATAFQATLDFDDDITRIDVHLDQMASLFLHNQGDALKAGRLVLNPNVRESQAKLKPGVFRIEGKLAELEFSPWATAYQRYIDALRAQAEKGDASADEDIDLAVAIAIERLAIGEDFALENLRIAGREGEDRWPLVVRSSILSGELTLFPDDRPLALNLEYLRLPGTASPDPAPEAGRADIRLVDTKAGGQNVPPIEVEDLSVLSDIDFDDLIAIDVELKEFRIGPQDMGRWRFDMRPVANGLRLANVRGSVRGVTVGSEDRPAELRWRTTERGNPRTEFRGELVTGDLGDALLAWDQAKILSSESARFDVNLRWRGQPDLVSLARLRGDMSLTIRNGSFARGAQSDETELLRLFALFNLDTLLRRLRLDFNDLTSDGYAFDSIRGQLQFKRGTILFTDPLVVDASSSTIQMAGTIDLVDETADTELVLTLPMASNIAAATAIVAGLPAALGIYVMSKLFKRQVDRASSVNVAVTGSWSDPKVKVKKIFDIDAASRRGAKVKSEAEAEEALREREQRYMEPAPSDSGVLSPQTP